MYHALSFYILLTIFLSQTPTSKVLSRHNYLNWYWIRSGLGCFPSVIQVYVIHFLYYAWNRQWEQDKSSWGTFSVLVILKNHMRSSFQEWSSILTLAHTLTLILLDTWFLLFFGTCLCSNYWDQFPYLPCLFAIFTYNIPWYFLNFAYDLRTYCISGKNRQTFVLQMPLITLNEQVPLLYKKWHQNE